VGALTGAAGALDSVEAAAAGSDFVVDDVAAGADVEAL
jgi:hypothetical protein